MLVTAGPYHFTRNPMYLGLTIAYLGEAGALLEVWPLPFLVLVLAYVNWCVVPVEEGRLPGLRQLRRVPLGGPSVALSGEAPATARWGRALGRPRRRGHGGVHVGLGHRRDLAGPVTAW